MKTVRIYTDFIGNATMESRANGVENIYVRDHALIINDPDGDALIVPLEKIAFVSAVETGGPHDG